MDAQRILVIDDSKEIVRYLTKQVLPTFGYKTLSAADGGSGLALIREEKPNLVMLDLNLPELNGLDVLRAMARDSVATPVILMTGYGSEKDAIEAFRLGIRDYLVKPFTVDEVIQTINKVLDEERKRYGNSEQLSSDVRRLKTNITRLEQETKTLFSIGKAVSSLLDVNKVIERVLDAAIYLTESEESTIWVLNRESKELRAFAKKGHEQRLSPVSLDKRDSIAAQVLREGNAVRKMAFSGGGIKIQTGLLARAVLYVPLNVRGLTIGVLSVSNLRAPRPFTERHESLLGVLSDYAAIALENSRTFQATDEALSLGMEELKTINRITRTITSHIDLQQVVQQTVKQVHNSWQVRTVSLWLYNEQKQTTRVLTNFGTEDEDILTRLEVPVAKGFVGHVVRTGKWIYTNEVNEHPLHYKQVDKETGFTTDSILCVPLIFRDEVVGAMQLVNKMNGPFDERDVERARSIGSAVAIGLSNALLFEESEVHQKQLEATLEFTRTPTIIVDKEMRLQLMNQRARELFRADSASLGRLAEQIIKLPAVTEILRTAPKKPTRRKVQLPDKSEWECLVAPIEKYGGYVVKLYDPPGTRARARSDHLMRANVALNQAKRNLGKLVNSDTADTTDRTQAVERLTRSMKQLDRQLNTLRTDLEGDD